jgi:hypothetical protein
MCCRSLRRSSALESPVITRSPAKLNERNVRTARGVKWTHVQVGAVLRPFEASAVGAVQ